MNMFISRISLFLLLFAASCFDIHTKKIPNEISMLFVIPGLIISYTDVKDLFFKLVMLVVLYCLYGMQMMGGADIKMWMTVVAFMGVYDSMYVILSASIFLGLYALVMHFKDTVDILQKTIDSIVYTRKVVIFKSQRQYPFAPFMLAGFLFTIWIRRYI